MSNNIVVAVSPFYTGAGWKDSFTGIEFKPNQFYHPIQISEDQDLTGIKRSLRLNSLILLKGSLEAAESVKVENLDPAELNNDQLVELVGNDTLNKDAAVADAFKKETEFHNAINELNTEIKTLNADIKALKAEKSKATKETNKALKEKDAQVEQLLALLQENKIKIPETTAKK